jgi:hypothetical protein
MVGLSNFVELLIYSIIRLFSNRNFCWLFFEMPPTVPLTFAPSLSRFFAAHGHAATVTSWAHSSGDMATHQQHPAPHLYWRVTVITSRL